MIRRILKATDRSILYLFFVALVAINFPALLYRALVNYPNPYDGHSPWDWIATAALNGTVGAGGIYLIFKSRQRKERKSKGACLKCGYDLRATPRRCPECGTIPKKSSRVSS